MQCLFCLVHVATELWVFIVVELRAALIGGGLLQAYNGAPALQRHLPVGVGFFPESLLMMTMRT